MGTVTSHADPLELDGDKELIHMVCTRYDTPAEELDEDEESHDFSACPLASAHSVLCKDVMACLCMECMCCHYRRYMRVLMHG